MDIRLVSGVDAAGIAAIYYPIVVSTPTSFEVDPPDEAEMRRRIECSLPDFPWLVCEHQGRVLGYAYAARHRARAAYQWSVDTSVYVDPEFHRRGIASGLYTSLFRILAAQGYFNAYAGITLPNPGSVALHESLGFQAVGIYEKVGHKLGRWHDVAWWQRPLRLVDGEPRPSLKLNEIEQGPSWQAILAEGLAKVRSTP
jgi:phosphinothricin acetyltransferase